MNINPYASPTEPITATVTAKKIQIDQFRISDPAYSCSVLSQADIMLGLHGELAKYCRELGFEVVSEGAEYHLSGELTRVEQGNRFLRSLIPGVLGAVKVEGHCRIADRLGSESMISFRQRKAMGFQGGNTRGLLELSLRQIAMKISSDLAVTTGLVGSEVALRAKRYLMNILGIAVLAAVGLALIIYFWAANQPPRHDGVSNSGKPVWACVVALFIFAIVTLLGLASAPRDVLTSHALLFLRSISGVKTITAQRFVIALLALGPIGLLFLTFMAL